VVVKNLPTYYGKLSYTLCRERTDNLRLILAGDITLPPGKIVVKPPLPHPLVQVEINGRRMEDFDSESAICDAFPAEIVLRY
jgi:hypothetical protein